MLLWEVKINTIDRDLLDPEGYSLCVILKKENITVGARSSFVPFGSDTKFVKNSIKSLKNAILATYNKSIEAQNTLEVFAKIAEEESGPI